MGRVQKVQKFTPLPTTHAHVCVYAHAFIMYARNAYNMLRICGNRIMDKRYWEDIRFCPYSISYLLYACVCVCGRKGANFCTFCTRLAMKRSNCKLPWLFGK